MPYPYETQQEHFQRFSSTQDSLASRIPLLTPHPDKGGPSANNLILSITVSSLPLSQPKITYLSPPSPSPFYIFLAPRPPDWTTSLIQFFPNQSLDFTEIPLSELPISTPFCFITEPVSTPFPIPAFHSQPPSLSSFGWINVSSFTSANVLFLVSSHAHLNLLYRGGKDAFSSACRLVFGKIPGLCWDRIIPPPFLDYWKKFLQLLQRKDTHAKDFDPLIGPLLPLFNCSTYKLPLRLLKEKEVMNLSGLGDYWTHTSIQDAEKLPESLIRDMCGNSFHPALISSA